MWRRPGPAASRLSDGVAGDEFAVLHHDVIDDPAEPMIVH